MAETAPATSGRADAGPLRVGVVGAGRFGSFHAGKMAAMAGVSLVAVADRDIERAARRAGELGAEPVADHRSLIGRIDAAVVASATASHHEVAGDFLDAGIDVFVEKPIAPTVGQADDLVGRAKATGAILQVGHIERFGGLFAALREVVDRPVFIEAVRIAPFTERGTDVSVVLDLMIHDIDLVLGIVDAPLVAARAEGAPIFSENDDIASARLEFENGCVANLTASRISFKRERRMRFFQADCFVSADLDQRSLRSFRRTLGDEGAFSLPVATEERQFPDGDPLNDELLAFVEAVRTRSAPPVTGEDGRRALAAAIRIHESMAAHRRLVEEHGLLRQTG